MAVKQDVVFIAGFPRSGSTLLGDLLGAMYRGEHIGETSRFFKRAALESASCSCKRPLSTCKRWSPAVSEIQRSFADVDVKELDDAMQRFTGMRPTHPSLGSRRQVDEAEIGAFMGRVLTEIAQEVDGPLIESSKLPRYGQMLRKVQGLSLQVIHLVRDPRGAINSRLRGGLKHKLASAGSTRELFAVSLDSVRWNRANRSAASLASSSARSSFVRYEDLVADPMRELDRIAREVGLEMRDRDRKHNQTRVGTDFYLNRRHVLRGNKGARAGWVTVNPDFNWVDELSPTNRRIVSALCDPGMRKYGYG